MYATITSTAANATDLGYLLHKHPQRAQQFEVSAGVAHVFYPEASPTRCTVALLLEVDPIALVRARHRGAGAFALSQYVNDRPYAATSMLAVALGKVFRTAMAGRCDARPELVDRPLPLQACIPATPSVGGVSVVRELFEPLGWTVVVNPIPLDETIPDWGDSRYVRLELHADVTVRDALTHLYVLLPVLDQAKHYWVTSDEVDKLLRAGHAWLATHPARDLIMRRYLAHQRDLVATTAARLAEIDDLPAEAVEPDVPDDSATVPLVALRRAAVLDVLRAAGVRRVVDVGCGEGGLLRELLADARFTEIVGVDVSPRALQIAERRCRLDTLPDSQRARLRLLQSSLTYRDRRIAGYDAIVLAEVIEHLDPPRLPDAELAVFADARPGIVLVTTPNADYNVRYPDLADGAMRHPDHRFEFSRAQFAEWAGGVAGRTGYRVDLTPIGENDPQVGSPTQMAIFTRSDRSGMDGGSAA